MLDAGEARERRPAVAQPHLPPAPRQHQSGLFIGRLGTDLVFVLGLHRGKVEITAEAVRDTLLYHSTVTATGATVVVLVALRADPAEVRINRNISV